jgi:hypothetical protein
MYVILRLGFGDDSFDSLASAARASADDSATADALVAALAASLDGVETNDIEAGECTDARRRLTAATEEARRLQSSSVSVEFIITVQAAVLDVTTGDDAADAIGQTLSEAVESGTLSSNIASSLEDAGIATSIAATSASAVLVVPPSSSPSFVPSATTDDNADDNDDGLLTLQNMIIIAAAAIIICFGCLFCLTIVCYLQELCCFSNKAVHIDPNTIIEAQAVVVPHEPAPVAPANCSPATVVTVPDGYGPGMQLHIQHPVTGAQHCVTIPDGIGAGQRFQVSMDTPAPVANEPVFAPRQAPQVAPVTMMQAPQAPQASAAPAPMAEVAMLQPQASTMMQANQGPAEVAMLQPQQFQPHNSL